MADWQPDDVLITMPTFSVSWSVGENLQYLASADAEAPVLSFSFNASLTLDWTYNVICEPNVGATANVVMLGAHLDSVPEGPGLDDNASGSSTLLEIAIQYAKLGFIQSSTNPVRFAWWAAEEIGLLGARHYVHELGSDINQLALYLNYDVSLLSFSSPVVVITMDRCRCWARQTLSSRSTTACWSTQPKSPKTSRTRPSTSSSPTRSTLSARTSRSCTLP